MKELDMYIDIKLNSGTVDRYIIRRSILNALDESIIAFSGSLLDVGCGKMPYKDYILAKNEKITKYVGIDLEVSTIHNTSIADIHWDGTKMPIDDERFDSAIATEVLEHCPEPVIVLSEVHRVLKPGGNFFFTVPFLWPLHEVPYDEYRYTPFALQKLLEQAGFSRIEIKPLGGWNASLAQMIGLWLKRSDYPRRRRRYLSYFLVPVVKYLMNTDKKPVEFKESTMITGLYGIAYK